MIALNFKPVELAEVMYDCYRHASRGASWSYLTAEEQHRWHVAAQRMLRLFEVPVEGFRFHPNEKTKDE